jgi:hypothetical protein
MARSPRNHPQAGAPGAVAPDAHRSPELGADDRHRGLRAEGLGSEPEMTAGFTRPVASRGNVAGSRDGAMIRIQITGA